MSDKCNFTAHVYDFEIRVGGDEDDLGNNQICYKQFHPMATGTQRFPCSQALLLGDCVSINKTANSGHSNLKLREVRVFGSKYSCKYPSIHETRYIYWQGRISRLVYLYYNAANVLKSKSKYPQFTGVYLFHKCEHISTWQYGIVWFSMCMNICAHYNCGDELNLGSIPTFHRLFNSKA